MARKMLRLKTTTSVGKVFLGPFVYDLDEKQAKRKLRKLDWLVPKKLKGEPIGEAKIEFIEVDRHPRMAIFDWRIDAFDNESELPALIKRIEKKWEELECRLQKEH